MKRLPTLFIIAAACTLGQILLALWVEVPASPLIALLALLCGFLAALFIFWPMVILQRHGGDPLRDGSLQTPRMVIKGPYAIVRHPLYLGYILVNLAFMLSNPHRLSLILGPLACLAFYLLALHEDERLLAQFGRAYQEYRRRVPAMNVLLGALRLLREGGIADG